MESAKAAVKGFLSKSGQHDTTVHEKVAPAVTNETVTRTLEDRDTTAIDKEVHQDHYHTSVQPVKDAAVKAETHHHNVLPTEHRKFEHGSAEEDQRRVAGEAAKFRDTHTRVEGQHATTVNPAVAGEHVHHHVHETIQPVVDRQVLEPHIVHNTVPVHEVHHNTSKHHDASTLPAVTMNEFQKAGGALTGREERIDGFSGEPRAVGSTVGSHSHHNAAGTTGTTGTSGLNTSSTSAGTTGASTTGTHQKASLLDKVNPKVDANGDGKAGFLS